MPTEQVRTRTVGCKMTESEAEKLTAVAEQDGQTVGEWCREVLLERIEGRKPSVIEETVLAEVLALRTILLNAFYRLAEGEKLTAEELHSFIERADAGKAKKAADTFAALSARRLAAVSKNNGVLP